MSFIIKTFPLAEFEGTKSLDGKPYKFRIWWNTHTEKFVMDMTSLVDSTVTIRGVALLPGVDFFQKYGWGDILGSLYLEDTSGAEEAPTFEGLGDRWKLVYYPLE